ncbi:MAG: phosphoribosylanthranilate isomerase [Roseovarius sp.]|nr:phosphoribosylanthranilate isomerase [Roseovarius sp.]
MSENMRVKICGLCGTSDLNNAISAGAAYIGFNFFPKSPRYIDIDSAANLTSKVHSSVIKVALIVNESDQFLDSLLSKVALDMLQLHGSESPERVAEIKSRFGMPVMKAIGIAEVSDLRQINAYAYVADQLLLDARPPADSERPGGNALPFDWNIIAGYSWTAPWMLAGGLTAKNVAEAVKLTGASQIDVASGVESRPGVKDERLIREFIIAAKAS